MTVVEYILDPQDKPRSFYPKTIPPYVSDGGYWINPDGSQKMIGVGVEGSIPDNITTFTLEELQDRMLAIHASYHLKKPPVHNEIETDTLTDDEVKAEIKEWWDARS